MPARNIIGCYSTVTWVGVTVSRPRGARRSTARGSSRCRTLVAPQWSPGCTAIRCCIEAPVVKSAGRIPTRRAGHRRGHDSCFVQRGPRSHPSPIRAARGTESRPRRSHRDRSDHSGRPERNVRHGARVEGGCPRTAEPPGAVQVPRSARVVARNRLHLRSRASAHGIDRLPESWVCGEHLVTAGGSDVVHFDDHGPSRCIEGQPVEDSGRFVSHAALHEGPGYLVVYHVGAVVPSWRLSRNECGGLGTKLSAATAAALAPRRNHLSAFWRARIEPRTR